MIIYSFKDICGDGGNRTRVHMSHIYDSTKSRYFLDLNPIAIKISKHNKVELVCFDRYTKQYIYLA